MLTAGAIVKRQDRDSEEDRFCHCANGHGSLHRPGFRHQICQVIAFYVVGMACAGCPGHVQHGRFSIVLMSVLLVVVVLLWQYHLAALHSFQLSHRAESV